MAVVQLRNGIYVNSIETVPDADQTAAYKYASLFTKSRKENWGMSQKQAASEIADAKARDAAQLEIYGQQLQDYNDRLKQLDQDIARTGTDVAKANAATQRTALQEATATAKQKQDWALKKAEQVSVSGGSRSSSSSSGTSTSSGGGGTGGGGSSAQKSADDLVNVEIGNQGDGGRDPSALQEGLKQGALKSANISNTDPTIVAAAKAGGVAASVGLLATDYRNGGYSEADALAAAEADVFQDLTDNNHLDAVDAYKKKQAVDLAGGGGRTSTSERSSQSGSVRDPATLQPRYKELGEMPTADAVTAESVPQVPLNTTDLKTARDALAKQLADLLDRGAPASTVDDFITRSREIMAGRFGSPQVSPNFYQRNAATASRSELDQAYAKFKGLAPSFMQAASTAVPTGAGTPGRLVYDTSYGDTGGFGEAEPLGSLKTSPTGAGTVTGASPVSSGATPTAMPIVTGGSAPAVSPGASGPNAGGPATPTVTGTPASDTAAPATAASSAADTAAASGASPAAVGAAAGAAAAAVPTAADTVRAVENTRLNNFPNRMTELDALFPDGVPQEVLDAAAGIRKSNPPPSAPRPQMQNPGGSTGIVGPFMPGFGDPTPDIGSKPEAVGDFSIPDVPSVYNDRPFDPVTNPYGGKFAPNKRVPLPPDGDQSYSNITYERGDEVPISDFERQQIIKLMQKQREENKRKQDAIDDAEDAKKKKPKGKTGYLQLRFDNAKEIVSQPGKLARLVASGPGKVAADVYNANKTSGKDFKLTYDTLTATYEDDKEALATAHQVALALDISARNRTAPPKA